MNPSFKRISWLLMLALLTQQPVLPILVERKQNTLSPVASLPPLPAQANVSPRLTNIKTVSQIFDQDELERYYYFDTATGNEISLRDKFDQLEKEYQQSFHTALASAAIDPETGLVTHDPAVIQDNIEKAEEIRKKVVRSFYEIGKTALDIEDRAGQVITFINPKTGAQEQRPYPQYAKNYVVALYALRKAIQMRPLTQQAYSESVLESDYRPAYDVLPQLHSGESGFNEEIKDADKLYDNAVQRFYSDKRVTKAEIVTKNIQYDLGIGVDWLFHGGTHTGRTFRELWEMALGLRALLLDKTDPRVTDGMKGRAAEFLAALFTTYIHNTSVSAKVDEGGGLTIPDEVYSASKRSSLEEFKKGEAIAFGLFAYNADFAPELGTTLRGHSLTVTGWLARLYRSIARQYYSSSVKDALELETQRIYPQLGEFMDEIHREEESFKSLKGGEQEAREALRKMMDVYRQRIPQALPEFREGKATGFITEEPVRIEFSPGPIGDSSRLSTDMPHLYCILNGSGVLTRDDGSIGRNIGIEVQIQDLDKMKKHYIPVSEKISGEPLDVFITVQSLDTNFTVDVENAQTIQAKTEARLVLHTLAAMGIFPLEMLDVAVKARQEKEVLREILTHILGEGKGLVIQLNVKKIAPNSGLAVSSLIATGVTTAFSRLLGLRVNGVHPDQPYETEQEKIVTVTLDAKDREGDEIGFYYVQISPSPQFREGETLTYTTDLVEGTLEVDVPSDDLKGSQSWYVRSRFIVCGVKKGILVETFDDIPIEIPEDGWGKVLSFSINANGEVASVQEGLRLRSGEQVWEYHDSEEQMMLSILTAQRFAWIAGWMSGTQDDVAGGRTGNPAVGDTGGLRLLTAGEPMRGEINGRPVSFKGGIIPTVTPVSLSDDARQKLERGVRILRIGMTDTAENTLNQVYVNQMINKVVPQSDAWAQITLEMVKALIRGDTMQAGRLARAAVPLRESLAVVSINPIVIDALETMMTDYGSEGFSYGITGARSTGSVLLFFPPQMNEERIQQLMQEAKERIEQAIHDRGKLGPVEDEPQSYRSRLTARGARIHLLDSSALERRQRRVIEPLRERLEAVHRGMQKKHILYNPDEAAAILARVPVIEAEGSSILEAEDGLTINPILSPYLDQNTLASLTQGQGGERGTLEAATQNVFTTAYQRFNAPGANAEVRKLIRDRLLANIRLIGRLSAERQMFIYTASEENKLDLLFPYTEKDIIEMSEMLTNGEEIDRIQKKYQGFRTIFEQQIADGVNRYEGSEKDGARFCGREFYIRLNEEIRELKETIARQEENGQRTTEEEFLLMALQLAPNPEVLPYDHFLFTMSRTYKAFFGEKIQALSEGMREGVLVYGIPAGGMGTRFGGANVIKQVVNWNFAHEADASYLKLLLRKWARFLERFPEKRKGFLHLIVSAFTEDAIHAVLNDFIQEAGLDPEQVSVTHQSLRQVVWPTPAELALDLALQSAATPQQREELERRYKRYSGAAKGQLKVYNDEHRDEEKKRIRSPFSSGGLNPLSVYSPSGTVGNLEGILVEDSGSYTVARLKRMGYEVDEKQIELIPVEEQGAIFLEQLEGGVENAAACWNDLVGNGYIDSKGVVQPKFLEAQRAVDLELTERYEYATRSLLHTLLFDSQRRGMPLAKAALVVKGNGLSVLVLQNSSSRAPVGGGDLAVADAMEDFQNNPGRMAVVQYANVAGGIDAGGVLVKNSEGFVESLEGNLKQFAEGLFLDKDYTAQATGTTFLNLKQIWKLMSYGGVEEYLKANLDERRKKMRTQMDQEWEPIYSLKQRREELVGRSDDWMVLQTEHVLARILSGWVPRKFGKETVRFQETTMRISYRDDKDVGSLLDSLTQDASFRGTPLRTRLPVNLDQHYHRAQAVNGWIEWAQLYRQIGLTWEAFIACQRARQALKELDKEEVSSRELSGGVREILSSLESELQRQIEETNTAHTQLTTEQITNDFLRAFNWTQNIGITELDASEIQIELESLSRLVRTIDLLLLQQQKTVSLDEEESLRFIRAEVIALINQVIDLVGTSAAGLPVQEKGFRVFSHKIRCLIDKDATIEDPGTSLQQAPLTALGKPNEPITPDQARQLIQFAVRGATIDILTGSTALEAWNHVFVPVLSVIQQMGLPKIAQVIVLRRIRILANDGSSVVSVDTTNNQFKAKKLEHNQRYERGQWVPLRSLLRYQEDGSEDKSNRLAVWNAAIRSFLKQFFSEKRPQDLLGLDENPQTREQQVHDLKKFIDQLELPADALPDMTAMSEEEFHNVHESLAWGLRQAINNHILSVSNWKDILNRILNPENGSSSLQNKLDGGDSSSLTADEELLAAFSLIHFKESDWTFGSISGDHLDKLYNNRKDHRLAPLAALLLNNTAFWSEVSSMNKTALAAARLVDQDHQEIPFTIRAGPGYFNVAFGGVSKINFLGGMLQDPLTLNNVVLVMGDSITDQGEFPTVARQKISSLELVEELKQQFPTQVVSSYLSAEVDSRQQVIRIRKKGTLIPKQLAEMRQLSDRPQWQEVVETLSRSEEASYPLQGMNASIAASFRIKLEGRTATIEFEGPMSLPDYAYLSRSVTLNHTDTGWNRAVIGLHHNSMAMHRERLLLRFLLGTMVEMDAVERSKRMRAGLLRTQYSFSTLDPLKDGHTIRRWGPAAFYPIVDAVLQVAEQDPIYGRGLSATEVAPIRDQLIRAVIESMNRSHVEGIRVIPPETLKKTRSVSSERQAESAPEHFL